MQGRGRVSSSQDATFDRFFGLDLHRSARHESRDPHRPTNRPRYATNVNTPYGVGQTPQAMYRLRVEATVDCIHAFFILFFN